jgi:hypothetical protein
VSAFSSLGSPKGLLFVDDTLPAGSGGGSTPTGSASAPACSSWPVAAPGRRA